MSAWPGASWATSRECRWSRGWRGSSPGTASRSRVDGSGPAAADAVVGEPGRAQGLGVPLVAAIEHHGLAHGLLQSLEVRAPVLVPLGDQRQGVRALGAFVG